ncbi:AsmA family protein [Dyella sp.]|jgi:uncharacterized protein involved in outer membrane biogenesis|uniref:AsmA family protein n=1 Tax=Dyella sp. TaxID=1869338 RepID=UPI002D782774|nr:AsmA family protein [Dyella sp.]HET6432200.1 AsmA family protein [Dyella sp.]
MKRSGKIATWIGGVLLALVTLLVLVVIFFDWNRIKPFINDKVSQAIGRSFAIRGDLSVAWTTDHTGHGLAAVLPWPQFTARDIVVANPDWAEAPRFAHLDALRFRLSPLPLLAHRIVVPSFQLVQPSVNLERDRPTRNNWTFTVGKGDTPSRWSLQLGDIGFDRGRIRYDDAPRKADVTIAITPLQQAIPYAQMVAATEQDARAQARKSAGAAAGKAVARGGDGDDAQAQPAKAASTGRVEPDRTRVAARDTRYQFQWKASGSYQGVPVDGTGRIGAVLALQRDNEPFPVQARVRVGDTHIGLVGTLTDPLHLGALDLRLWFAGSSMARLYPLIGVTLPDTRPYATGGRLQATLDKDANRFSYRDFHGRVGDSDLYGDLLFVTGSARPKLSGNLHSQRLEFGDLAPLIGVHGDDDKTAQDDGPAPPPGQVLPVEPFRTDRWKAMDADVSFKAAHIAHVKALPIDSLDTHVTMDDGLLHLDPLQFGLADGHVRGALRLDGSREPMRGSIQLHARHLQLKKMFPTFEPMRTSLGEINGDTDLDASGNSVAALLGSADGELKLLMNDGAISKTLLETAGLNLGNVVIRKLFGDKTVQINCAASDFAAKDGVFSTQLFVFDTTDARITVDGTVDLGTEKLDLDVKPQTKGLRILSLRSPLYVRGTLKNPDVGVHAGPLALRAAGAVALGAVAAPAAALLALVSPDHDESGNTCRTVLGKLRSEGKPEPTHAGK